MKIALCNHKMTLKYNNQEKEWSYLVERNRNPIRTAETVLEYMKMTKDERDAAKDVGGYFGGWLKNGLRRSGCVECRSFGMLDADHINDKATFLAKTRATLTGYTYFIYSTHSHRPDYIRYRVVILFDREVTEEEYPALMRMIASKIGMDYFDDTTYQANRMMFWASCPSDGEFFFEENQGTGLDVKKFLEMYDDWRDISKWPMSARQSKITAARGKKQADPLEKEGIVGAFCRTYSISSAISAFLSDVYAPTTNDNRYDYIPAESMAGVVVYDDKFSYSFHESDPACGKLRNAFDLVRVHKFGVSDDKKSFDQMCAFASELGDVKQTILAEKQASAKEDFSNVEGCDDWQEKLRFKPKSKVLENSVYNELLILRNDSDYANFAFNELANRIQVTGELPWERPEGNAFWRDADTAQLKSHLDMKYGVFSTRNHDVAFTKIADDRHFHPVRNYLDSLPEWDGIKRVEDIFIRYLKADDTEYVRAVTRKTFAAAVARIYVPGTKFDCVPVLDGDQGIGKSTIVKDLVTPEYYSETLSLTDMDDKSGAEKLQGFWIVEIGELAGMKKADIEKVKAFLSTSDDKYRPSYGKVVESHPRQCIIIATVNGERGYLRDITGNRRFWIIKVHQKKQRQSWSFTEEFRQQFWAEAKAIWKSGEKLYLEGDVLDEAESAQRNAMEKDERVGMIEEYLNTQLPDTWEDMDLYSRRQFLSGEHLFGNKPAVAFIRKEVSNAEIWCECFGRSLQDLKPTDSYSIGAMMAQIADWERTTSIKRQKLYGRQRLYRRIE